MSQSRIMAFNATAINARASPVGDAVHTRPRGLTNVRGLPCQDRWSRLKKQVGRLRVVSWNVGTMTGHAVEIADVLRRRKVDIACVLERGSSEVECRTRNRVSPGSNPPLLPFRRLGIFVLSIVVPVDSAV